MLCHLLYLLDPLGRLGSGNYFSRQFAYHRPCFALGRSLRRCYGHCNSMEPGRRGCHCRCLRRVGIRHVQRVTEITSRKIDLDWVVYVQRNIDVMSVKH